MALVWNPFVGCVKFSEGCKHCYIEKGALKYGYDFNDVHKTKDFYKPILKDSKGEYKMKSGFCYLCFQSDFFIDKADSYRNECFQMIKERQDCTFLVLTKRIERFIKCIPSDYNLGYYDNLIVAVTIENQKEADKRMPIFNSLNIKRKMVAIQPMLEKIEIEKYLDGISKVEVGGEQDRDARVFNLDWALDIRRQCINKHVTFIYRQAGSNYMKNNRLFKMNPFCLMKTAREEDIDYIVE